MACGPAWRRSSFGCRRGHNCRRPRHVLHAGRLTVHDKTEPQEGPSGYRDAIMAEATVLVEAAGHEIAVTSPSKVFFPERGETKLDLVSYYLDKTVEEPLMRAMQGRPVLLQRYPNGAGGPSFFQKRVPEVRPEWLQTAVVSTPNGTTSDALVAADLAHVIWAVNLGCIGFHVWPSKADDQEHADELRIDLDPSPGVTFAMVQEAAREVRRLFNEHGVSAMPKTTGNRGIHIYVRLQQRWTSYEVRSAAVAVARELERRRPELMTSAWWKEERGRRVFIDYNQNAPHKTIFGAWSVRARPGAQVSTPFGWDELDTIQPDALTIATVPERVRAAGDPWAQMSEAPQSLEPLLAMHERDTAAGLLDAAWPPVYPKMPGEPPRVAPSRARKAPRPE
jgi:DNA ligase D